MRQSMKIATSHPILMRGVLFALVLASLAGCGDEAPDPGPTVALATPLRGEAAVEREGHRSTFRQSERIEGGATVEAQERRVRLLHDSGAQLLLDSGSRVMLELDRVVVEAGRVWIDAASSLRVEAPGGWLRAADAGFAVDAGEGQSAIYCGFGELGFGGEGDDEGLLAQGEELNLGVDAQPRAARLWNDWTGGLADPAPKREGEPGYVGVLAGRALTEGGRARRPLSLRSHDVAAVVHEDLATTTVTQTFFNAESATLEASYRIRIPEGAVVSGFAVDRGNGLEVATPSALQADAYTLPWIPRAETVRLAYDAPGVYRAWVSPIAPGQTIKVQISYSEWLDREGERRRYVYPMAPQDGQVSPLIGEFSLRVDTSAANVGTLRAGMGARSESGGVVLRESDLRPRADFYLDLFEPTESPRPAGATAYVANAESAPEQDNGAFALFDVPLPGGEGEGLEQGLELVIVVDGSGGTDSDTLALAQASVDAALRLLGPGDRVALRIGDVGARALDDAGLSELAAPNEERNQTMLEAIGTLEPGGATDLATMLREAGAMVAGRPLGAVLYIGDAKPTTGALTVRDIRERLGSLDAAPRYFGVALGEGANLELLERVFGPRQAKRATERSEAFRAVHRIVADAGQPLLRDVQVELGVGVERVFPRLPTVAREGSRLVLVGRLAEGSRLPAELRVTARRGDELVELRQPLRQVSWEFGDELRRRWARARMEELVAADAGREALVELGTRFGIVTPWTSLSVAMMPEYQPIIGFDCNPQELTTLPSSQGWRRRLAGARGAEEAESMAEETWERRVFATPVGGLSDTLDQSTLGRASLRRTLVRSRTGPDACFSRWKVRRPELAGSLSVRVRASGSGTDVSVVSTNLDEPGLVRCVVEEVRGMSFEVDGTAVELVHRYQFGGRETQSRGRCSDASRQGLRVRQALWRERLAANAGLGALDVWRDAEAQCELGSWSARRALLSLMLQNVRHVHNRIHIFRNLRHAGSRAYWRRAMLRQARTPEDLQALHQALGVDIDVDWRVFRQRWERAATPAAKLRLVRRWLAVFPDELDLRLREIRLLEDTEAFDEAARRAEVLRRHPLADARVVGALGEFWLRRDRPRRAQRVFSELVERAPRDPWARRRLGDLYRAHGWFDAAYREYTTLATLVPDDTSVLLLLARAAVGAGRWDEALRLQQRVAGVEGVGKLEGTSGAARLWLFETLAALGEQGEVSPDALRARWRRSGAYRGAPAVVAVLTWEHPEDLPTLSVLPPSSQDEGAVANGVPTDAARWQTPELSKATLGIAGQVLVDAEEGTLYFRVGALEDRGGRRGSARLRILRQLGTDGEGQQHLDFELGEERVFAVSEDGELRQL